MSNKRQIKPERSADFFARTPVFTLDDFATALGARSTATALNRAKYYLSQGRLKILERGLYAAVPPDVTTSDYYPDAYVVAATVRRDAVFSYHTALELLGVAYSAWSAMTVTTDRPRRPLLLGNMRIEFLGHPAELLHAGQPRLGTQAVEPFGRRLTVTGRERTLVDGFRRLNRVGGLDELLGSAAAGACDFGLLERVLTAYGHKRLWAAVGWFCEREQTTLFTPDTFLHRVDNLSFHERTPPIIRLNKEASVCTGALPPWNMEARSPLPRPVLHH